MNLYFREIASIWERYLVCIPERPRKSKEYLRSLRDYTPDHLSSFVGSLEGLGNGQFEEVMRETFLIKIMMIEGKSKLAKLMFSKEI